MKKKLKRIMGNKIICVILFYCSILFVLDMLFLQKYMFLLIILLLLGFTIMVLYKLYFHVSLINIKKIKELLNYNKVKKKLGSNEIYSKITEINTFDGSGSLTHPSVLYFENGFNGYKYWMAYTPYNNCDISLENPCIAVSKDGIDFVEFPNLINPLLPILLKGNPKKYYNDPNLVFTNCLELWYRYTVEYSNGNMENYVYRITSKDGLNWTCPQLILKETNDMNRYMSMTVLYENNCYKMYYVNKYLQLIKIKSRDLKKWTKARIINIPTNNIWHGEVKYTNGIYYLLYIDKNYNLNFCVSKDGINFGNLKVINMLCKCRDYFYYNWLVYKSSIVFVDDYIYLYTPFRYDKVRLFRINNVISHKWHLCVTKIKYKNIENICKFVKEDKK